MALPAGRYGVTKNQLLKIKKLPMNTIKLIEELTEKFDLLGTAAFKNSTSVVTQSTDLVESGAVKDIVGWGNANLFDLLQIKSNAKLAVEHIADGIKLTLLYSDAYISTTGYIYGDFSNKRIYLKCNWSANASVSRIGFSIRPLDANNQEIPDNRLDSIGTPSPVSMSKVMPNGTVKLAVVIYGAYDVASTVGDIINYTNVIISTIDSPYEPYHASVSDSLDGKMSYADNGVLGAKQFIPLSLEGIKELNSSRTWNGNSCSHNGITFTVNTDSKGSVTSISTSGTATGFAFLRLASVAKLSGSFKLNGGISSNIFVYIQNETTSTQVARSETGDVDVNLSPTNDIINCILGINPNSGGTNTIYPMLRLASDTDPTYQPYAQTNRELTVNKCDTSTIAPTENGSTIQKSGGYAVGSHAIRNKQFITWKNAKAQGETINDVNDYTSGDVASELTSIDVTSEFTLSSDITWVNAWTSIRKVGNTIKGSLRFTTPSTVSDIKIITVPNKYKSSSEKSLFLSAMYHPWDGDIKGVITLSRTDKDIYIAGNSWIAEQEVLATFEYDI